MGGSSLWGLAVRHAFMLQLFQQASLPHAWLPLNHHDAPLASVPQPAQSLCHLGHISTWSDKLVTL